MLAFYKSDKELYDAMSLTITNVDKSQNSLVYNTQYPVAMELASARLDMDEILKMVFASLASANGYSEWLDRRVEEVGIERKLASYARVPIDITGRPYKIFPKNTIVGTLDGRKYVSVNDVVLDEKGKGIAIVEADEPGSDYNVDKNEICILYNEVVGVSSITNPNEYEEAYDAESDSALLNRYYNKVRKVVTSGNKNQYEEWCLSVDGVGNVIVKPLWNGRGTVKCIISDANNRAASPELIKKVKDYIAPDDGSGVAPIGATVTISTIQEVVIDVYAKVELAQGNSTIDIASVFKGLLADYFKSIEMGGSKVSYAKIEGLLSTINKVLDIDSTSLTLNGEKNNITLTEEQVPIVGNVTLELM